VPLGAPPGGHSLEKKRPPGVRRREKRRLMGNGQALTCAAAVKKPAGRKSWDKLSQVPAHIIVQGGTKAPAARYFRSVYFLSERINNDLTFFIRLSS
jgi:hypothetical protein